jgi:hypothetical protein
MSGNKLNAKHLILKGLEFDPARFIGENTQPDPRDVVFGFGRRSVCVLPKENPCAWRSFHVRLAPADTWQRKYYFSAW